MIGIDYKYQISCGFCGGNGHNITTCSQVNVIAEDASMREANGYPITYRHKQAIHEMQKRKLRETKRKAKTKRTKAKCSFCRNENHRRPNCQELKTFRKKIYHANTNWKKRFVEIVNKAEIGIGSLVTVPKQILDWTADRSEWLTCMVLYFDLDTINVFNCYEGKDDYRTTARMKLVVVDTNQEFYWNFNRVFPFVNLGITANRWHYNVDSTKVISGCSWKPHEGWLTEKNPEIEYVLKKISTDNRMVMKRIQNLIKQWDQYE